MNEKCDLKYAHHDEEFKKKLKNRLNRIEGQVRGINKMISNDVYCDDVLNQISSVQSALRSVGKLLLEAHLKSCVVEQLEEGKEEVLDELMTTISRLIGSK